MTVTSIVQSTATWMMSHRTVLFIALILMMIISVAGWYYVDSTQRTSQSAVQSETNKSDTPPLSPPVRSDVKADETTIETTIKSDGTSPTTTQVNVNGQTIKGPQSGTVHKTIKENNGTTTVDISVDANSSSTSNTHSSTSIEFNSSSEVKSGSESSQ